VLTLAQAWTAGGGEPLASALAAARAMGREAAESSTVTAELRLADELGSARGELDFLSQASLVAYRDALELRRALSVKAIQVAIAVVVGFVVIAIYLPLFNMGAIV
jgi:type II secretory pathway component PulF